MNKYKVKFSVPNDPKPFLECDFESDNIQQCLRLAELKYPNLEITAIIKK